MVAKYLTGFLPAHGPYAPIETPRSTVTLPLQLPPLPARVIDAVSERGQLIKRILTKPPSVPLDGPILCHYLRAYGLNHIGRADLTSGADALSILTTDAAATASFGKSLLLRTRYGVRYRPLWSGRPGQDGESHRDVCLATFGEIGIPLDTLVSCGGTTSSLQALLDDSRQTFELAEAEIAWTAIAYALYLPPQDHWTNRDGNTYCFNDVAAELDRRSLGEASCGGAHLLMAMTLLLRADECAPILSPATAARLRERLKSYVAAAVVQQAADGSWTLGWHKASVVRPAYLNSVGNKLLVTGHLTEWMEYLPADLAAPTPVIGRAADWLCATLSEQPPSFFSRQQFCPWTHSICALRNLLSTAPQVSSVSLHDQ